jgi:hypothetical protein
MILNIMIISFDFDGTLCWVDKNNISIFRRNINVFNQLIKSILDQKTDYENGYLYKFNL